ncbi:Chaperone protein DnaK, partial [Dissostichus eleginoides]
LLREAPLVSSMAPQTTPGCTQNAASGLANMQGMHEITCGDAGASESTGNALQSWEDLPGHHVLRNNITVSNFITSYINSLQRFSGVHYKENPDEVNLFSARFISLFHSCSFTTLS